MAGGAPDALRERAGPLRGIPTRDAGLVEDEPVLDRVVAHSLEVTHSSVGLLGLLVCDGDRLELVSARRVSASVSGSGAWAGPRVIPVRGNLIGAVVQRGRSRISDDAGADPDGTEPGIRPPLRTFLGVPLRLDGVPIGVLAVANKRSRYTAGDEHLVTAFGEHAAVAIDNERLRRRQRDTHESRRRLYRQLLAVTETERRSIAGDIHDDVMQKLTAVELRLQRLRARIPQGPERLLLDDVSAAVEQTDDALRLLLFDLRPPPLDLPGGLSSAIRTRLQMLERETGIRGELRAAPGEDVPPGTARTVFRLLQEGVANAATHSGASHLLVVLDRRDGGLLVRVQDDGRGFSADAAQASPGHLGLALARERADLAGGWFRLVSEIGAGTTVEFWVPVDAG
jgi:signal transduction histidine kinase